jgi:hypothetical protein
MNQNLTCGQLVVFNKAWELNSLARKNFASTSMTKVEGLKALTAADVHEGDVVVVECQVHHFELGNFDSGKYVAPTFKNTSRGRLQLECVFCVACAED